MAVKHEIVLWTFVQIVVLNLVISKAPDPPKIQPFVFPDNLEVGTQTRVTCGLQKGSLPVRFTWKKNGTILNPVPDKIRFLKDDGFVVLEIKHLDVGDVANYTCSVRNREGEDSFTYRLVVTGRVMRFGVITDIQ